MYKNKTEKTCLIDGDCIIYPVAAKGESEELTVAEMLQMCMLKIDSIMQACHASSFIFIVSGSNNFRKVLHPDYKAGRPPKPVCYGALSEALEAFIGNKWYIHPQLEADDLLGIIATNKRIKHPIICTIDKDLLQITGWHYNFYGEGDDFPHYVSQKEADLFWTQQMLTGDSTDNIEGIKGIGPVKARKLMHPLLASGWEAGTDLAKEIYRQQEKDVDLFIKTLQLVTIWRKPMPEELLKNELIAEVVKTLPSLN